MSAITNACDRILACLQKTSLWDAQNFQPGLSHQEIKEKSKELLFPLTPELYELYQWRNGKRVFEKSDKLRQTSEHETNQLRA